MNDFDINKHPLLKGDGIKQNKITNDIQIKYSKQEIIVTCISILTLIISIFCCQFWIKTKMDDDLNPIVAFAIIPVAITHILGLIVSIILPVYSYENELKTKKITLIIFCAYLVSVIIPFII